jgi:fibronectin type 3 domain-containing protein
MIGRTAGTPPTTTYTDINVKNNVTYTYFVTAVNADGTQSSPSNIITLKN